MANKITNVNELREDLIHSYERLKANPKLISQTKELASTAAKVISTLKVQLEYSKLRKEIPHIGFLNVKS